jgi:hypothetical protein
MNNEELLELAWGVIANAGGGDWDMESYAWRKAAIRWRDAYFKRLKSNRFCGRNSEQPNNPQEELARERRINRRQYLENYNLRTLLKSIVQQIDNYLAESSPGKA